MNYFICLALMIGLLKSVSCEDCKRNSSTESPTPQPQPPSPLPPTNCPTGISVPPSPIYANLGAFIGIYINTSFQAIAKAILGIEIQDVVSFGAEFILKISDFVTSYTFLFSILTVSGDIYLANYQGIPYDNSTANYYKLQLAEVVVKNPDCNYFEVLTIDPNLKNAILCAYINIQDDLSVYIRIADFIGIFLNIYALMNIQNKEDLNSILCNIPSTLRNNQNYGNLTEIFANIDANVFYNILFQLLYGFELYAKLNISVILAVSIEVIIRAICSSNKC